VLTLPPLDVDRLARAHAAVGRMRRAWAIDPGDPYIAHAWREAREQASWIPDDATRAAALAEIGPTPAHYNPRRIAKWQSDERYHRLELAERVAQALPAYRWGLGCPCMAIAEGDGWSLQVNSEGDVWRLEATVETATDDLARAAEETLALVAELGRYGVVHGAPLPPVGT
jgi:hypothetical protein